MPDSLLSFLRRRWRFVAASVVVLVPIFLLIIMRTILASLSSPAALVERLESEWNARVEVGGSKVRLLGAGPNIMLRNVRIAPRDHLADNAVPLGSRPAMLSPVFEADAVDLEIRLSALLGRRLEIKDMQWTGFRAVLSQDKKKAWNTEPFRKRPEVVAGKPRRAAASSKDRVPKDPETEEPTPDKEPKEGAPSKEAQVFMAENLPMAASAQRMAVEESAMEITLERKSTVISLTDFSLIISDLDVDPGKLATHNTSTVRLASRVRVHNPDRGTEQAMLTLSGGGELIPFNPATGALAPVADLTVELGESSVINLLPTLEKLRTRLDGLSRFGIKLVDEVGTGIHFEPGTPVHMRLEHGRLTLVDPLPAKVNRFDLTLQPGSWYEIGSNEHEFKALIHADDEQSSELRSSIVTQAGRLPRRATEVLIEEMDKSFFVEGAFKANFTSSGDLGDPVVKLENELPDLGRLLGGLLGGLGGDSESRDELRDAGRDLLRNLFNRNE